jgi:hypothetical protein
VLGQMPEATDQRPGWVVWLLAPLVLPTVALFVLAPLGLLALLSMPVTSLIDRTERRREELFERAMAQQDRFVPWEDLEPWLESGKGTLIVEQANKRYERTWWTTEDVANLSPVGLPSEEEPDYHVPRIRDPHPFVFWCLEQYLHPETGRALLTRPAGLYSIGYVPVDICKSRFPKLTVVMTERRV